MAKTWLAARRALPAALLIAPPFLLWLLVVFLPPMNHDVAGLLAFTGRWLEGEDLYRDLIDVNPPLIMMLNVPAVLLGRVMPGGPVLALQLLLLAGCAACALLAIGVMRDGPGRGPVERAALTVALPLLLLLPGYEFGQRDHIMMALALPYLLLAERRAEAARLPWRLVLPVALLAGVGFAIKPHFLLLPLLVEAWLLRRRGLRASLRDPVPWVMVALWIGYLAVLMLGFPDYLRRTVPLALGGYAGLQAQGWLSILLTDRVLPFVVVTAALGWLALRRELGALPIVLALAGLAGLLAALAQQKGFAYHSLGLRMATLLLVVVVAARALDRALSGRMRLAAARRAGVAAAWGLGCVAMLGAEAPWVQFHYAGGETDQLATLFARDAADAGVLVLSPAVNGIYPALNYAGAHNILPTMTIWPLQNRFLGCPRPSELTLEGMDADQRWFLERTVARFVAERPALLVIAPAQRRRGCEPFDLLAHFTQHPAFRAALADYAPRAPVFGYTVWHREASAGQAAAAAAPGPVFEARVRPRR